MAFYTKEFVAAISHLPSVEKDKLILRLLKKDLTLANRLQFELVDDGNVEERRTAKEKHIITNVKRMTERFYKISYLNMDIRYLSGDITEHVKITKDKYGDASLNLLLLIEVLRQNKDNILTARPPIKLRKFCTAIIARVFKVLLLIHKMDEDLLLDFKDDLIKLGKLIGDNDKIMKTAIKNGLDVNWLIHTEIPENLVKIHRELKNNGLLK
ncbi:hypothetical protein [Lutibacter sp.]|uniref:hypothetical protein n=1 Tax=Lutibacter sp. TaxID=1925666 RepID=UPI0025C06C68|nr:hypothetical protein [Lutibacter sp.]MCF6182512.1 hypothetical protein [Lutibacter sp.]